MGFSFYAGNFVLLCKHLIPASEHRDIVNRIAQNRLHLHDLPTPYQMLHGLNPTAKSGKRTRERDRNEQLHSQNLVDTFSPGSQHQFHLASLRISAKGRNQKGVVSHDSCFILILSLLQTQTVVEPSIIEKAKACVSLSNAVSLSRIALCSGEPLI